MSERSNNELLFIANSGMDLTWLFAWATFITRAAIHRPFPLPEAIFAFGLAALLLRCCRGKGWRMITIIGVQFTGFIVALGKIIHAFDSGGEPFFNPGWIIDGFTRTRGPGDWALFFLLVFWAIAFWASGVAVAGRSLSHLSVCARFDWGVAALGCLLLLKLTLRVRMGAVLPDPISEPLIFPFFAFALPAVGLARNRGAGLKNHRSGCGDVGWILSFSGILLFLGAGTALLFLPYLAGAAEEGFALLKTAAEPLGQAVVVVIRFIFLGRTLRMEDASGQPGKNVEHPFHPGEPPEPSPAWMEIMLWGAVVVITILALFLAAMGVWFLVRWLVSRDKIAANPVQPRGPLFGLAPWLHSIFRRLLAVFLGGKSGPAGASRIYERLRVWGKSGGLPCRRTETPLEYGFRLIDRFPTVRNEIGLIVDLFNQATYGEISPDAKRLQESRFALKRLNSPRYWSGRARSRLLRKAAPKE